MNYYEIEVRTEIKNLSKEREEQLVFSHRVKNELDSFNDNLPEGRAIYLCRINKNKLTLIGRLDSNDNKEIETIAVSFLGELNLPSTTVSSKEITVFDFQENLNAASRNDFIYDADDEMERLGIENMSRYRGSDRLMQRIFDALADEKAAREATEAMICFPEIKDEIDRILSSNPSVESTVHPVHYVIMSDDRVLPLR